MPRLPAKLHTAVADAIVSLRQVANNLEQAMTAESHRGRSRSPRVAVAIGAVPPAPAAASSSCGQTQTAAAPKTPPNR